MQNLPAVQLQRTCAFTNIKSGFPSVADHNLYGKFLSEIHKLGTMSHFFIPIDIQQISILKWVLLIDSGHNLKLAVFLFNFCDIPWPSCYSLGVPKSHFPKLYKTWCVLQLNCPIPLVILQDLPSGCLPELVECMSHLHPLLQKSCKWYRSYHSEWCDPSS